jgi:nicotinamidase-related amidase
MSDSSFMSGANTEEGMTIIDEWSNVKAPPAPQLKAVTIDPETTALLILDLIKQTCNREDRPRCLESLPYVKKLLDAARAKKLLVVYSLSPGPAVIADTLPEVAPNENEPFVKSGVDKFYQTDLERILTEKNIRTLIIVGTAAHGAVLYTASEAVVRGFNVIVPVDGVSAESTYIEQYVAYNFYSAPIIAAKVTLTSTDMVKF